ncbi:MAG: PH domain-containing protein [Ignavibacteria bacterium]|nr:PH domain-containing protein [Ignavibacteria bacterium]
MSDENKILIKATFNPVIRSYIFVYVGFILLVTIIGIPLLIIWMLGLGQWYSKHYYELLECELSERSIRFKKGILFTKEKTIPLENIQDMTFIEGPLLRKFNLSIFKVETAGRSESHSSEMELIGIEDAHVFRKKVFDQRQVITNKRNVKSNETVLSEIKDALLRIELLLQK